MSHVQTALEMAISRDGASGGLIRLCVVSAKGVERWTVVPGAAAAAAAAKAATVDAGGGAEGRRQARGGFGGGG